MTAQTETTLPASLDSERAILGMILLDSGLLPKVAEKMTPGSFYLPHHREVFAAMIDLYEKRKEIDPILIAEELKKAGSPGYPGGTAAITNLTIGLPVASNPDEYVKIVRNKKIARDLLYGCERIKARTMADSQDAEDLVEFAEREIAEIFGRGRSTNRDESPAKRKAPVLSPTALYGLPGEIVGLIEPHTEADNAALLVQLLAGFGILIGRKAHFKVEGDRHYTKIFAVLVGATAAGRKGTSWGQIKRLLTRVDPGFQDVIQNGLSSGEGLIYHVRDQQTQSKPLRENGGAIAGYQDEIVDEGARDKRAFVIEPEFARVLKAISREGNTLSPVIRSAWDDDRLSIMTKTPLKANDSHISIVGHITDAELIRNLQETETSNGFANRFLWVAVKRSKYLPHGGNLAESDLNRVVHKLQLAATYARQTGEMHLDPKAIELWERIYKPLSDGFGGLLGSVTSRATAQVKRIACLYALLDCSEVIKLDHLRAALAVWQYCEDSAKYVFGMSTGDKLADSIFKAIEASGEGVATTDIHDLCGRNRSAKAIEAALALLLELGRIEKVTEQTAGRPKGIYRVVTYELNERYELSNPDGDHVGLNSFNSFNS